MLTISKVSSSSFYSACWNRKYPGGFQNSLVSSFFKYSLRGGPLCEIIHKSTWVSPEMKKVFPFCELQFKKCNSSRKVYAFFV